MKTTLAWLENHIDLGNISISEKLLQIINIMNSIGIEVESIGLCNLLLVGKIISVEHISNTELYNCKVDVSELLSQVDYKLPCKYLSQLQNTYHIVTKISNIKENTYLSFIPYGNKSPDGMLIIKRKMMGYLSEGMFNSDNTFEKSEILNMDIILHISPTTNRPDLKTTRGIAYDISSKIGIMKNHPYDIAIDNILYIAYALDLTPEQFCLQDCNLSYEGSYVVEGYIKSLQKTWPNCEYAHTSITENSNIDIFLSHSLFFKMTNIDISLYDIQKILSKIGFTTSIVRQKSDNINIVHDNFGINCVAPIWRSDIDNEMSIIHEILRIYGVNYIYKPKLSTKHLIYNNPHQYIHNVLTSQGFTEVYNFPFIDKNIYNNPSIITNLCTNNIMRDTLLYPLLRNAEFIFSHNEMSVKVYEIGKVYPSEEDRIGILMSGYEMANILRNKKEIITSCNLQNILSMLNMKISECNNTECKTKLENWHQSIDIIAGCYCNFILKSTYKLGRDIKTYYYYESNLQKNKHINTFTDSMQKFYTNINMESIHPIIWGDIQNKISKYEHNLIDSGFYKDKYKVTFSIAYKNEEELQSINHILNI